MRKLIALVVGAMSLVIVVGASGGPATSGPDGIRRDGARGVWFMRACGLPILAHASCGAQVVTNSAGTPLVTVAAPPPTAYGPAQFHAAYNLPTTAPGSQTIGIVDAFDDPNIEGDLAAYDAQYGLQSCTTANGCFTKVNQAGGTAYPASNAGWSLEISLDVETAHEICQNCKILLVEASSASVANLGVAENEAVAGGATVISNSWGAVEYSSETTDESRYFNHPGVAITASTGDNGYGVLFPAASRYVTAVGGTTLNVNSDNTWKSESAWSGSGSGCSRYIPKPSWQTDPSCSRRTVADVSADADPNTGAAVYDTVAYSGQTGWFQVGGTSLASPLIASVYALTGTAASTNAGSAPYSHTASLHDVTSGSNGSCGGTYLCTATAGYDGPTGLGTPNGTSAFSATQGPPPADFSVGVSPSTTTVTAGTNASYTVTVGITGGFPGTVNLSQTGLPNGTFTPSAVTGGGNSTLSVATGSISPGSYPFTITGTSGTTTRSVPATLVVQAQAPPADFSVGVSPSTTTVTAGTNASYTVTVGITGGFPGTVNLSQTGLPNGTFTPSAVTGGGNSTLSVATGSISPGSYPFTITGTSGTTTRSVPATLVVQAQAPPADFSVGVSPSTTTVTAGTNASYTVTVGITGGFPGTVNLSQTGLPNGTFTPSAVTGGGNSTLSVATGSISPGSYPFTITGASGTTTRSVPATLVVQAAAPPPQGDFSISVAPKSRLILEPTTSTFSVTVTPTNGFNAPVTLSATGFTTGLSGSFSPNPGTSTSTFSLRASGAPFGMRATITITGTSGTLSHSATISVTVI